MIVAAIAVNVIPGIGQVLSAAMITGITTAGIGAALGMAAGALGMGPKAPAISKANNDRLWASVDVTTPRKIMFGVTAAAVDIRHQEWGNADGTYSQGVMHRVFFHASHRMHSIDEIWLDERKAWTKTGGVESFYIDSTGSYQGSYLGVTAREEGTSGNTININGGSRWGSTRRCTGLAYSYMWFRVVGVNKKDKPMESPFSSGIPARMTVRGRGAPVYDPRQDTTVGGSGTMRANDQATWAYTNGAGDIGRNPALQILWYLLGWRIEGKLALGRGIPASRINMASFIAAANACDETVTSSVHGTEPRYRSDGMFSENDDPGMVLDTLKAACNADLRDLGGILSLHVRSNDLATVSVQLSEADILGGFIWKQTPDVDETFNEVRGRYTDPSDVSLYQLRDYPAVRVDPVDGIERNDPFDLPTVQSVSQAQRLAKIRLSRNQYRGVFAADFSARAWKAGLGKIVELSLAPLGWTNKKFRVLEMGVRVDGVVPMLLQEEHANVYLWDDSDTPAIAPFEPTYYNPALAPGVVFLDTIQAGATVNRITYSATEPTDPVDGDIWVDTGASPDVIKVRVSGAWQTSSNLVTQGTDIGVENGATVDANIALELPVVIFADATGTPKAGELSKVLGPKLIRNGVALTSGVTWSGALQSGNATFTISGSGTATFTITGPNNSTLANESVIRLTAAYLGITRTLDVKVVRQNDPPTNAGGGSNPGTTASTTTLSQATATSYPNGESAVLTCKAGTAGQVACTAPLAFKRTPGTATGLTGAFGKWQWRVPAGTWADIAAEVASSLDAETEGGVSGEPTLNFAGSLSVSMTKTGLTSGADYEFKLLWRKVDVSGDVDNIYRTDGTMQAAGS